MKIEKLSENKIKIIINNKDLEENHIDLHSFMSNSLESQNIFLNLLDTAEKEVGFITDDYKITIETLLLSDGNFILIVTRANEHSLLQNKKRVTPSRYSNKVSSFISIYKFDSFENFCMFCTLLNNNLPESLTKFDNINTLYTYNDNYFLSINTSNVLSSTLSKFSFIISEFGEFVPKAEMFLTKLLEAGTLVSENNAISSCILNFKL